MSVRSLQVTVTADDLHSIRYYATILNVSGKVVGNVAGNLANRPVATTTSCIPEATRDASNSLTRVTSGFVHE